MSDEMREEYDFTGGVRGKYAVKIVDNSMLAATAACDGRAAIRYVLDREAEGMPTAPMRVGTAVHEALGAFFATGGDVMAALAALDANYSLWAIDHVPADDRLSLENVQRIVTRWMEVYPPSAWPFKITGPADVERPFQVPLMHGVDLVGRWDAIGQDIPGGTWVVEIKTTGRMDERWARGWRLASQLTGYTWAAQQELGHLVSGCFVLGLEMDKLPSDPKRKCKAHGVAYAECGTLHAKFDIRIEPRAPHQLDAWHTEAKRLAMRFQALRTVTPETVARVGYQGMFNGECRDCPYNDFCAMGRPAAYLNTMTVADHWDPRVHAKLSV